MRYGTAILLALAFAAGQSLAVSPSPAELAEARQWTAAKFEGLRPTPPREPGLVVLANHGLIEKNSRASKPLRLGNAEYRHGLYCHAFSKIIVRLPGPGKTFTAVAGVDSNDQTSGGRGSVDFLVRVAGQEAFRSGILREGMPGKPVEVDIGGAEEFVIQISETSDGITCDQADWAEAEVTLQNGRKLWLADLPLVENTKAPYSTNAPFSFLYDNRPSSELLPLWPLARASRQLDPRRIEHKLTWTDPRTRLEVRCDAIEYRDFPVAEWTVYFKNTGTNATPVLSEIQALDTRVEKGAAGDFVLHHHTGDLCTPDSYKPHQLVLAPQSHHRFSPAGGRPTSSGFPYFNVAGPGQGVIVAVGWPGQWQAQFIREEDSSVRIRAGQELTRLKLEPGEEIRTPLMVLQFWNEDRVRAQNIWRRWMLAHNLPRTGNGKLPKPILTSCSGGFFPGIQTTEAGERQFITAFTQAGIQLDYWWLDAGWYPCNGNWPNVGNWSPDPARFPRGLKAVSDHAHANGMGLIVWFEPERVSSGTWLYTNNPAWLLGHDGDQKLLNLGHNAARKWLTDHVDAMLTRDAIDFYRQDFNIDPLPYWRANDRADRQGVTEIRYVEGYLAYWDELRRRHPGLLIDSCASGGRRNDLETLRRAVPLLRSDYQAFDGNPAFAPGNQGHTYGLSSWIPYYGQGVYYTDRHLVYSARSYLSPAFAICADVRKPGVDWALIRNLANQWRAVADCYLGDFYPLTPYRLEDDVWLAWQFDLPENGKGFVQAFRRNDSLYESARFKLHGLDARARYRVTNLDQPDAAQEFPGSELIESGLLVTVPGQPGAVILTYTKIGTSSLRGAEPSGGQR